VVVAFALLGVSAGAGITANSSRDRTISFYAVNTKETLAIQYMKNGKHIPEAMEKINWILRDWRKDEPTQMDPDLIDLVWEIHNQPGAPGAHHVNLRLPFAGNQRVVGANVGRPGEPEPPYPRQGDGRDVPRCAGEEAALFGPHPRTWRRWLLSNLGHPVR